VPGVEQLPPPAPPHAVPFGRSASVGHALEVPLHTSAGSHAPADGRQVVEAGASSATHVASVPEQ
jgi:hypothetical protein